MAAAVKLSRRNGFKAWWQLKIEYESQTGSKYTAMLRLILTFIRGPAAV